MICTNLRENGLVPMYLTTYVSGSLPFAVNCSSSMLMAKKAAMKEMGSY